MNEPELLFTELLNCDRMSLYLNKNKPLDKKYSLFISSVLKRRIAGEPIQYILGKTEFMGLDFKVNPAVLIPRPETEILVEATIKFANSRKSITDKIKILDLGTGSGCIAVSLANFLPYVWLTATDISLVALEIAHYNAILNKVADKIRFVNSDLFTGLKLKPNSFDIIVSNPPYIVSSRLKDVQLEVRLEPQIALDGGSDGLDFYRKIIREASGYLKDNGLLIMEIGFRQAGDLANIFNRLGNFKLIELIRDYSNLERVIVAEKI